MLKVATLAIAMMASTAAFAVELHGPAVVVDPNTGRSPEWQATDPVYGMEYCGQNPQPNYCLDLVADINLARLMFDTQPVAEWEIVQATRVSYLPPNVSIFVQHVPAEDNEAAPLGLVGEPFPPGIEQQPGGIGSDYVAQAKGDRAVVQANNCPQPTAEANARLCNPAVLTANAKDTTKKKRTHKR